MKTVFKILFALVILGGIYQCNLTAKTKSGYQDFSNNSKLDSNQIALKETCLSFFNAVKNKDTKKVISLSCDTVYCSWEAGLDSALQKYNSKPMSIQAFINSYYPQVLEGSNYYTDPKEIFYIVPATTGHLTGKEQEGIFIKYGPKKCPWDNCSYNNFEFLKTKNGYKFLGMWHI